jgi:hypothetical protein
MRATKLTAAERLANRRRTNARAQAGWRRRRDGMLRGWKRKCEVAEARLIAASRRLRRELPNRVRLCHP